MNLQCTRPEGGGAWIEFFERSMLKGGFGAHRSFESLVRLLFWLQSRNVSGLNVELSGMSRKELGAYLVRLGLALLAEDDDQAPE